MLNQNKNFNLVGVAYLRFINSSQYFKQLAREAYSIFDHPDALDTAVKILFTKEPDKETYVTPALKERITKTMSKYSLTGGLVKEFLECKVDFDLDQKLPLVYDIFSEVFVKDGIVTKIEHTNLERAYDRPKVKKNNLKK